MWCEALGSRRGRTPCTIHSCSCSRSSGSNGAADWAEAQTTRSFLCFCYVRRSFGAADHALGYDDQVAREFNESEYPEKRLTGEIIGAFYYVYHRLGYGFLESVYKKALLVELRYRGIPTAEEVPFEIPHRGVVTAVPRVDLLVDDRVIVETKAGTVLDPAGAAQLQTI